MTSNAVRAKENEIKNRELDLKNKKLPHELALMEQEKNTSRSQQRLNEKNREMAAFNTAANMAQGIGKGVAGIAALANDFSFYTKTGDAMLNLLRKSTTDQASRSKQVDNIVGLDAGDTPWSGAYNFVQDWKPGIYAYDFVPSIDHDINDSSSTAIAIRKFNTRVRGDNSGATNYDSVDLFQYPLATDSIATILAWCERGLDLINYRDTRDLASLNDNLLVAHCWGRADLAAMFRRDANGVINVMNRCINQMDALQIPFEIDYIKRHAWLAKKIFVYGKGVSKRYILFRPEIYRVYDEASGSLKAYSFKNRFLHLSNGTAPFVFTETLDNILTSIIGPLATSQATATMSGDIAKAFGYDGIQFQKYPLNYPDITSPAFEEDEQYLMSIRNAIISPLASTEKNISLYADELEDLSIRQAVNEKLNPVLFMGHLYESGDSQETCGPSLNATSVPWLYSTGANSVDINQYSKANINPDLFNYVDYRDTFISEEDQLYNYSFRHNYMVGKNKTGGFTTGIDNCRSEIIVRGEVMYTTPSNPKAWQTFTFNTFMADYSGDSEYSASDVLGKANKVIDNLNFYHHILGSEKYAPMILEFFVLEGDFAKLSTTEVDETGASWIYLVWDRHFHREINTTRDMNQINYEALVNLFIQGANRTRKPSRGRRN